MTGLKGGASCQHRSKKSLINAKAVRSKLKKHVNSCEECDRLEKNGKETIRQDNEVHLCLTCGLMICSPHAKLHCEAIRTGDGHPFVFYPAKSTIRCHPCDTTLEPLDDNNDPVRLFYNDYKSFNKNAASSGNCCTPLVESLTMHQPPEKSIAEKNPVDNKGSITKSLLENGSTLRNDNGLSNSLTPAKGLPNLGNTCFYNSVMQCIMHTHHFLYYFEKFCRVKSINFDQLRTVVVNEEKTILQPTTISIEPSESPLNFNLHGFLSEFRAGTSPSPGTVFAQIAKKAPRFKGWQQQDAHELLRYLLDGLRSEELEWYKQGIANHLGLKPTTNPKKIDPILVKTAKGYLQAAGRPLLDAVFGGTLLQTIKCSECGHISDRNEQFLDLSVPITNNSYARPLKNGCTTISNHQKKKLDKQSRKALRRHQPVNKSILINQEEEDFSAAIDCLDLSENSEDDENFTKGALLDYTKVLVPPPLEYSHEKHLGACLLEFTAEEILSGPNAYECEKCCTPRNKKMDGKNNLKKLVEASKRYLIYEPPVVLTLHLKRFQQLSGVTGRLTTRKLGGHISFPLLFDIAPFCCKNVERLSSGQKKIMYSLYGVVVHSGDLSGGHYIAYVKSRYRVAHALNFLESARASSVDGLAFPNFENCLPIPENPDAPDGQWYYCSDSRVNAVSEAKVLGAEAYILFYERIL